MKYLSSRDGAFLEGKKYKIFWGSSGCVVLCFGTLRIHLWNLSRGKLWTLVSRGIPNRVATLSQRDVYTRLRLGKGITT